VLLGGGCFQNRLLLELSVAALRHSGLTPLWPQQLPCNDAALAVGQLLALQREPAPGIAEAIACHASEPCL
jgi:hydrogenase maturation protein HypF